MAYPFITRTKDLIAASARFSVSADRLFIWLIAAAFVALSWILQSNIGINLADEGYLWYGSWRVGYGEVPLRDFSSYDPGRYYWTAFWSLFFGDGILGVRAGVAIFQVIGLGLGLLAARTAVRNRFCLIMIALLLTIWMYPRHKLFECALAMGAVYVATIFIRQPNHRRFWQAGLYVGLAGFFGRNSGIYILLSYLGILLVLRWNVGVALLPAVVRLFGGMLIGYAPMLFLCLWYPGFATSLISSVVELVKRGKTNLPTPIPWPWRVSLTRYNWFEDVHRVSAGIAFIALYAFFPIAFAKILRDSVKRAGIHALLVGATFVGITYAHHASVRADLGHLTQAIHPMLLGMVALLALPGGRARKTVAGTVACGLAILTIAGPGYQQPFTTKVLYPDAFVSEEIQGERLWISGLDASVVSSVPAAARRHLKPGEFVFFAPVFSALYAIMGQQSPVWNIYPIGAAPPEREQRIIEDFQRAPVTCAILVNSPPAVTQFSNTHPRVWKFLNDNYKIVDDEPIPPAFTIFVRDEQPKR